MNVLVAGSGGREHALAWRIARSPGVGQVYAAPGNPGTGEVAENVAIDPLDFQSIHEFCRKNAVDLVVVGPENPLAAGLADFLRERGVAVFGPGRAGAKLESSKAWAKDFMRRHGVPCASYAAFDSPHEAVRHLKSTPGPWVIKADGLALGKGVTITGDLDEAMRTVGRYMDGTLLGEAGRTLVIEEYLEGRELTAMALTDGESLLPLPFARDHKRALDGDRGPMTGGMGAFSPVPLGPRQAELSRAIIDGILRKTVEGLREEGIDYRGVLYAGLMLTESGPKVLEYNVRFGDPEAQCVLPLLEGDFAGVLLACAEGRLKASLDAGALWTSPGYCVSVVMASQGYPGAYPKGIPISGLDAGVGEDGETVVFHAGTKVQDGKLVTAGGRVLAVTSVAPTLLEAVEKAYRKVRGIQFQGAQFRSDIARDVAFEASGKAEQV